MHGAGVANKRTAMWVTCYREGRRVHGFYDECVSRFKSWVRKVLCLFPSNGALKGHKFDGGPQVDWSQGLKSLPQDLAKPMRQNK